jgi:Fe-S cluster biosynthesis and repair protein YggX
MPYSYHKQGDKYVVTKKDTGKVVGHTKGTKEALKKYLAALHINANEGKMNTMKKSELRQMIQEIIKEVISEQATNKITEAYVPDNIKSFAKRKGVSSLVNTVASWAEKAGKRITGGTAIGKNYSTLILDMGYQTADIYIDTEEGTIELYGEPVRNFNEFKKVWLDQMTADEMEKDANQFRRESGLDESVDYDTAVAYRITTSGNRDEVMAKVQGLLDNLTTGKSSKFPEVKVTMMASKGNPNDIILKLNGPGAFSMSKDIKARPELKGVKVSTYKPQLTKVS